MANQIDYPAKYALEDGSGFYLLEDGSGYYINELQNYPNLVVSDGAFAYWRLDEASGSVTDLIGGVVLDPAGSLSYSQPGALVGDSNTGIAGDGTSGQTLSTVSGSPFSLATHPSMTFECWFLIAGNPPSFHTMAALGTDWNIQLWAAGSVTGRQYSITSSFVGSGGSLFGFFTDFALKNPGTWLHLVMVMDGGTNTTSLYANANNMNTSGTPMVTSWTNLPPVAYTTATFEILGELAGNACFGTLDEVAFYPTALTASQVAEHYAAGLQYFPNEVASIPSQMVQLLPQ